MQAGGVEQVEAEGTVGTEPHGRQTRYAGYTHSAVFAEVRVDEELGDRPRARAS